MPRRSKLEIYLDVLSSIKRGTKKPTRIMYEANLSWKPLQQILKSQISQELIVEVDAVSMRDKRTSSVYELTQKGENVINYFNRGREYLRFEEIKKVRT
jgi:predicted transcriptional regulator